jgi:putative Mg2+ transporter-C (MgtC) family protein
MGEVLDYLQGMDDAAVIIRLVFATVCGSLIGWERVVRRHSAGIRTFALVSLGSAVAAVLNLYLANLNGLNADVSRIPAGVRGGYDPIQKSRSPFRDRRGKTAFLCSHDQGKG